MRDGIATLLERARERGMPLAIEPLHPMFAADRACINTLEQALDVCDALDPSRSGALGVAFEARAFDRIGRDHVFVEQLVGPIGLVVEALGDLDIPVVVYTTFHKGEQAAEQL